MLVKGVAARMQFTASDHLVLWKMRQQLHWYEEIHIGSANGVVNNVPHMSRLIVLIFVPTSLSLPPSLLQSTMCVANADYGDLTHYICKEIVKVSHEKPC